MKSNLKKLLLFLFIFFALFTVTSYVQAQDCSCGSCSVGYTCDNDSSCIESGDSVFGPATWRCDGVCCDRPTRCAGYSACLEDGTRVRDRRGCAPTSDYCAEPTPRPSGPVPPPITPPPSGSARPRYQIGSLYPFPCDRVAPQHSGFKDDEFHTLRPYQKSPCNPEKEDLALFCGNDLVVSDTYTIIKTFNFISNPDSFQYIGEDYAYEGSPISPNPPWEDDELFMPCRYCNEDGVCVDNANQTFCFPDSNQCDLSSPSCDACTQDPNTGLESCSFTFSRSRDLAVDLEMARFPIMGYTEPSAGSTNANIPKVINSQYTDGETLNDPSKVNEYVSWYLHGINEKAEYGLYDVYKNCISDENRAGTCERQSDNSYFGCWDPFYHFEGKGTCTQEFYSCCVADIDDLSETDTLDRDKLINFSGPLKKLLPIRIQNEARETQIDNAYWSRYLSKGCSVCYGDASPDYPISCSDGITCCETLDSCPPNRTGCVSCTGEPVPGYPAVCSNNTICCSQQSECP